MRLFIAVEIDDHARIVAEAAATALKMAIGPALKARWVAPENMHITVRFIGHVDDHRVRALIDGLTPSLDVPAFDIELGECGVFPHRGPPRAVWIGLAQGLPLLASMHDAFTQRLLPFGFAPEARAFSAHLTLARLKDPPKGAAATIRDALRGIAPRGTRCHVSRATLFQSHLSSKGPSYLPLAYVPLAAAEE